MRKVNHDYFTLKLATIS